MRVGARRDTPSASAPAPVPPAPTPWQARCTTALEQLERDAGRLEPDLRTAEIRPDGDPRVTVYAGPPVWKINLSIQISREPGEPVDWQEQVESLAGRNHDVWHRRTATADVAILLDGWEAARAERIEPVLRAGVEPCLL